MSFEYTRPSPFGFIITTSLVADGYCVVSILKPKKEFAFPKAKRLTTSTEDYMLTKDEIGHDLYQKLCMQKDIVDNYVAYNNHFLKFAAKQK